MAIRTRRWNDPAQPGDGTRILVCRYRPRGVPKSEETWDQWLAGLAPSKQLHAAVYGKSGMAIGWSVYRQRYLAEMRAQRGLIAQLAQRVRGGQALTLLCSSACENENRCHRSLLRDLIEQAVAAGHPPPASSARSGDSGQRGRSAQGLNKKPAAPDEQSHKSRPTLAGLLTRLLRRSTLPPCGG